MFKVKQQVLFFSFLILSCSLYALERFSFSSSEKEGQFNLLVSQLRCVVCDGQSLNESFTRVAMDIKKVVHNLVEDGNTNEDIKLYLTDRYGDYILYSPPVNHKTWLLWGLPWALLAIGVFVLRLLYKKSKE